MASGQADSSRIAQSHSVPGDGFDPIARANIRSVTDALLTVPIGYIDATVTHSRLGTLLDAFAGGRPKAIAEFQINAIAAFDSSKKPVHPGRIWVRKSEARRLDVLCQDAAGAAFSISVFGNIWAWKKVADELKQVHANNQRDPDAHKVVKHLFVVNSARRFGERIYLDASICSGRDLTILGHVAPMYAGIPGAVTAERMTDCIDTAVGLAQDDPNHWIAARDQVLGEAHCSEEELLAVSNTSAKHLAVILRALHRPQSFEEGELARKAVIQIAAAAVRSRSQHFFGHRGPNPASAIPGVRNTVATVLAELTAHSGITLTANQLGCVNALATGMEKPQPTAHMLNGDVGSGKTLTFLAPAIAAFRRGKNVAIMAPTGILADQLARQLVDRFPRDPVARLEAGDKLPTERSILVGTPGLTTICHKARWVPDVLIIDEQHKLPAPVREALVGEHTHVIEATATPIPRSMAIAMYAGMTQLILQGTPFKNTRITRAAYGPEARAEISGTLNKVIKDGGKVAFVYPAVVGQTIGEADDQASDEDAKKEQAAAKATVLDAFARLNTRWPGKVARLYGDMSDDELRAEINAMRSGEKNVMVASSIVEVGIDIPELNGMVINEADRFGLAQLHQLRGRIARNGGTGHFFMHMSRPADQYDKYTIERMRSMEETSDGFRLAEIDLMQRGFGDTAGEQQSGRGYTIFRGIALSPRDFLKLSLPENRGAPDELPPLPDPEACEEDQDVPTCGQLSLI